MNGVERAPAGTLLERTADIPVFIPISAVQSGNFHDKVRSILVLPGALGADHLALMKDIHPLAAEDRMAIRCCQGECHVFIDAKSIAAIMGFPVNNVPGYTKGCRWFFYQRNIISARTASG